MIKQGWTMTGDASALMLQKDDKKVVFDIVIPTEKGMLLGMYLKRQVEIASVVTESKPQKMTVNEAHGKLGHSDEPATRKTAKTLGIQITRGTMKPCEACTVAKAKQKNVPKVSDTEKGIKTERRIFFDIFTIKRAKNGPHVSRLTIPEKVSLVEAF
jgi:hypothetical protein